MKKHVFVYLVLGLGVLLTLLSCDVFYPEPSRLISPEDGEIFDIWPPTFIWESSENVTDYIIKLCMDSFPDGVVLVEDTVSDTIYQMPEELFNSLSNGTYSWMVAYLGYEADSLWSDSRTFNIEREVVDLLYNSYFPMDVGYEWVYERLVWFFEYDDVLPRWYIIDRYEINLKVDSVTKLENGWMIFHLSSAFFLDIGKDILTNGYGIIIDNGTDTISTDTYRADINSYDEIERSIGFGTVYQLQRATYLTDYEDHLKYFRKGDTIWRYQ